jgi:hypothetical protein
VTNFKGQLLREDHRLFGPNSRTAKHTTIHPRVGETERHLVLIRIARIQLQQKEQKVVH